VIVIGDVVRVSPFAPSHFKTADFSTTTPNSPRSSKTRVLTP
jgi:uroporphyrin-III C-methyltransferase/precorrin-2 dehydrogenase/sirohydrochlorin ferrochelatase